MATAYKAEVIATVGIKTIKLNDCSSFVNALEFCTKDANSNNKKGAIKLLF
jgi:hypothetical protein